MTDEPTLTDDLRRVARLMGNYSDSDRFQASYQLTRAADMIDALLAVPTQVRWEESRRRARGVVVPFAMTTASQIRARMAAVVEGER